VRKVTVTTTRQLIDLLIEVQSASGKYRARYWRRTDSRPEKCREEPLGEVQENSQDQVLFSSLASIEASHGRIVCLDVNRSETAKGYP
jgi:hypothetical protein